MVKSIEKEIRDVCLGDTEKKIFKKVSPYRRIAFYFSKSLSHTAITPNQITTLRFILLLLATSFFFWRIYLYSIIGAVLFQIALFLDYVDGDLARIKKQTSILGHHWEVINDHLAANLLPFVAMSFYAYTVYSNSLYLYFGLSAIIFALFHAYTRTIFIERGLRGLAWDEGIGLQKFIYSDCVRFTLFILLIASILNITNFAVVFFGVLMPIRWAILTTILWKKLKKFPFSIYSIRGYILIGFYVLIWVFSQSIGKIIFKKSLNRITKSFRNFLSSKFKKSRLVISMIKSLKNPLKNKK